MIVAFTSETFSGSFVRHHGSFVFAICISTTSLHRHNTESGRYRFDRRFAWVTTNLTEGTGFFSVTLIPISKKSSF